MVVFFGLRVFSFLLLFFDVLVRVDERGGCCVLIEKGRGCITGGTSSAGLNLSEIVHMALAGCFYSLIYV